MGKHPPAESSASLRPVFDALVLQNISPVATGLTILYVAFAVSHLITLPDGLAAPMSILAATTGTLLLGLRWALERWSISPRWAHPLATGIAGLVLLNSLVHLYLTAEPQQTTNLMVLVIGCGFLFLSTRWFVSILVATLGGWSLALLSLPPSPAWSHFGFGLLSATVLSVLVHITRVRTLRRMESLRLRDERRKAKLEKALQIARESEEKYRDLLENANDLIQSVAPDGSFLYVNRAWRETLGYSEEDVQKLSLFDIIPPKAQPHCREVLQLLKEEQCTKRLETTFLTKDGRSIVVEGNVNCQVEQGDFVATRGIFRDITERKRAEEALRESEARIRAVLNTAVEGIITINSRGIVESLNPAAEDIFGYDANEVIGQNIRLLMPEPYHSQHEGYIERYLRTKEPHIIGIGREVAGRRKDGETFPMELSVSEVKRGQKRIFTGIVRDITERKRAERQLRDYSERLEEMVDERTRELREAQERLLEQQRLEQEVQLAAEIQASLLPEHVPSLEGFEFAATALPARHVSGDLYDFILPAPDGECCHIVLADIAGKGIPAALLTSTARTLFRAETEHDDSPGIILSNINRSLHPDLEQAEMFITFLSARLDVTSGRLTYANAGHTEALWCQGHHACARLSSTGLPVGIFADTVVEEEMINLRPGDSLVFYSDGVTEAANSENDLFGIERLTDLLIEHSRASAPALRDAIVQAVESFRSGSPRSDDLTLVVLKARPRAVAFSYPGELEHLNAATGFIREAVLAYGETFASQMELAASEIITNVMRYAYRELSGDVDGEITLLPDRVRLDLYDHGASFDPAAVPDPDLENSQEGGYGLYIVRQIMDEVTYTPDTPNGNHWRLVHSGGNPPPVYAL